MPPPQPTLSPALTLHRLATLQPTCTSRTWQSVPHPHLPIIATAVSDRTVRVYSLTNFSLLHTISGGHKRSVRAVSWKPHSQGQSVLATGSFDASAGVWRRWERGGGDVEKDFTRESGGDDGDDGGDEEDDDYNFSCILDGHESEIKSLAWNNMSGSLLATCSRDKSIWIWEELEEDNFETVAVLQEHEADVKCVAWHTAEDLLASASYDDTIRLWKEDVDDWVQVALLAGHEKTVWWVEFEGAGLKNVSEGGGGGDGAVGEEGEVGRKEFLERRKLAGPRLVSSSDDCTVRIWRRIPKENQHSSGAGSVPSILRSHSVEEEWVQETILPQRHDRAIYSVSWSRKTGMIVSAGSDGRIVVYQERWRKEVANGVDETLVPADELARDGKKNSEEAAARSKEESASLTEWVVVAEIEGAHDVFEINHVCWARRCDKGKRSDDEEVIISTGDDGEVKVWTLDEQSNNGP
ncbi:WD40 repeat-like protein [Lepidopterella palustris CBS 459.81]|uniref:Probable cytosolic iron-sulfur protein assembly protein 1 n=1 Tax=Lepidopterella palustris CBS 459.81 TaxID=1314670 RepID=A0A8E2EK72_9PEZI|nr:WD40 repeat-like protein [Lepidopterella palustris CBS 459.81]